MLKVVVAPILLFALGFVPGLIMSAAVSWWWARAAGCIVLWSPVFVLLLLERFEAVEPGTLSLVSAVLPRAVKLPLMGLLLGYGLHMLRFDHRNEDGHFGFTSLIVDAIKPHR